MSDPTRPVEPVQNPTTSAVTSFLNTVNPGPAIMEMMRIFPDGLIITSGFYALLTQSVPFAIFSVSMIEAAGFYHFIRWVSSYLNIAPISARKGEYNKICRTGFTDSTSSTLTSLSMFSSIFSNSDILQQFPSSPIYMVSAASAYVFSTLNSQSRDLSALGPMYSVKYYISIVSLFTLIAAFMCFRIFNNCETVANVMLSVPIGLLVGVLLVQQNIRIFGKSGINLLGIPQMSSVTANGQTLYVCPGRS
jgi:hypothetical protein